MSWVLLLQARSTLLPFCVLALAYNAIACLLVVQDPYARVGRLMFPFPLVAFPFYLWKRSPGKQGSHYDPACDLFNEQEADMVCGVGVKCTVGQYCSEASQCIALLQQSNPVTAFSTLVFELKLAMNSPNT